MHVDRDKHVNSVMEYKLGMTQGHQLDQSLLLRLFKSVFDNVLLEQGAFI